MRAAAVIVRGTVNQNAATRRPKGLPEMEVERSRRRDDRQGRGAYREQC
ncbi:MAG: hypothetical protein ACE5OO_00890 [Candidatus Bathyarchaeia archaeon]